MFTKCVILVAVASVCIGCAGTRSGLTEQGADVAVRAAPQEIGPATLTGRLLPYKAGLGIEQNGSIIYLDQPGDQAWHLVNAFVTVEGTLYRELHTQLPKHVLVQLSLPQGGVRFFLVDPRMVHVADNGAEDE